MSSELVMKDLGLLHFFLGIDVIDFFSQKFIFSCSFIMDRRIRYEALQSEAGRKLLRRSGRAPDDISSVVLVERDRSHIKSEAVLKIMEYIDLPFPQLAFFLQIVPLFLRDFVYDNVANNRYTIFGRSESCEIYYD
ncbi:hypothetical protein H0E87_015061 [Populus deltoides]|uniref:DCC family protein n=1 Tax=Populus deltoides TaxID=3696 RepID=A0A8T2Y3N1_POPDE|nr:hypothetical protein H0E87_015061 [Populus deltoides]